MLGLNRCDSLFMESVALMDRTESWRIELIKQMTTKHQNIHTEPFRTKLTGTAWERAENNLCGDSSRELFPQIDGV